MLVLMACLGAVIGSFCNMLIHRLPRGEEIVIKPSHCPHCHHRLGVWDLFPILSYLTLRGKCRYCKTNITARYWVCEVLCILVFCLSYQTYGLSLPLAKSLLFFTSMIIVFFVDLEHYIIPDVITLPLMGIGLVFAYIDHTLSDSLWGLGVGFSVFFLIATLSKLYYKRDAFGGGDVKLSAVFGSFWGLKSMAIGNYLGFIIGGIIGITMLVLKKKQKTDPIPFGPAMIIGMTLAVLYGSELWHFVFRH